MVSDKILHWTESPIGEIDHGGRYNPNFGKYRLIANPHASEAHLYKCNMCDMPQVWKIYRKIIIINELIKRCSSSHSNSPMSLILKIPRVMTFQIKGELAIALPQTH